MKAAAWIDPAEEQPSLRSRLSAYAFGFLSGALFCLFVVFMRFALVTFRASNRSPPTSIYDPASQFFTNREDTALPTLWIAADESWSYGGLVIPDKSRGIGEFLAPFINLPIQNRAIGGRSARSYTTHGDWARLQRHLQPRDFVLLSFGNNDHGDPKGDRWNRTALPTDDMNAYVEAFNGERVGSWIRYMQTFVHDIKNASAIPILSTSPAFNHWDTEDDPPYYWPGPDAIPTRLLPKLAEWEDISWIDFWNPMAQIFKDFGYTKATSFQEDIHGSQVWNEAGARLAAETWIRVLKCSQGKEAEALKEHFTKEAQELERLCP